MNLKHFILESNGKRLDCISERVPADSREGIKAFLEDAHISIKNVDSIEDVDEFIKHVRIKGDVEDAEDEHKFDWCVKLSLKGKPFECYKFENGCKYGFYLPKYHGIYDRYFSRAMNLGDYLSKSIESRLAGELSWKFYSVASSSRFVVSCFTEEKGGKLNYIESIIINGKDEKIKQEEFEHSTHVKGISIPKLDFFFKTNSGTYFIEAKNHEILDSHKWVNLRWSYYNEATEMFKKLGLKKDLIEKIKEDKDGDISLDGEKLLAESFDCKLNTFHFDFKQFLCHLMGILLYHEKHPTEELYFYYLVYRNKRYEDEFKEEGKKLYDQLEEEVKVIFDIFSKRVPEKIHLGLCYHDKYDTLKELKTEDFNR